MNTQKIRELCARAIGLERRKIPDPRDGDGYFLNGVFYGFVKNYDPLKHADQASELLETVAAGRDWYLDHYSDPHSHYCCDIQGERNGGGTAETENLAKILCSLRASPEVTDAEINDAMEGE